MLQRYSKKIRRKNGVVYSALVPNTKGLEHAVLAGVDKISVFTAASETFNIKNINTTMAGSLERFRPVVKQSKELGLPVRGYISTAFWCAFEGKIAPDTVVDLALISLRQISPTSAKLKTFINRTRVIFWVALFNKEVVGTVSLLDIGHDQAALRKMFVNRGYRGKKYQVALTLLNTLLNWAQHPNFWRPIVSMQKTVLMKSPKHIYQALFQS